MRVTDWGQRSDYISKLNINLIKLKRKVKRDKKVSYLEESGSHGLVPGQNQESKVS